MSHWFRSAIATFALSGLLGWTGAEEPVPEAAWGLPETLRADLARTAKDYLDRIPRFRYSVTATSLRYRPERVIHTKPGGEPGLEFRLEVRPFGPARSRVPRRTMRLPSAHDWASLFSSFHQPYFMYREVGIYMVDYDLVREIEFRGCLPFYKGRDIREWEGIALVELVGHNLVEVRARPRNQGPRMAKMFDRWSRAFRIRVGIFVPGLFVPLGTFRTAPLPLAHEAFVRFDHRQDRLRLPTVLRYETRRAVRHDRALLRLRSTRHYRDYEALAPAGKD